MKLPLSSYLNEHTIAAGAAIMLHVGVATAAIPSAEPVEMRQQVIRISMVAPSSDAQQQTKEQVRETPVLAAPPKPQPAARLQKKAETKPVEKKTEIEETVSAPAIPTSGLQAPDATEKAAARTEPVFNAAYLNNPVPVYPQKARRNGVQGKVTLEVDVTAQGGARSVKVAHSSGSPLLDEAAQSAVRQWRFVPARLGDRAVDARVNVPVDFRLR